MTTYSPQVFITEFEYETAPAYDALIDSITITGGRSSITEQPMASTASVTIPFESTDSAPPFQIGYHLKILMDTGCIFLGKITDISISTLAWGSGAGMIGYTVYATDVLGDLVRMTDSNAYAKQFEGTRIAAILTNAGILSPYVSTPGAFEVAATNGAGRDVLTLCQEAADSGRGVFTSFVAQMMGVWVSLVRYDTYLDRATWTVYDVSPGVIEASSFGIDATITTVANKIKVTNYTGAGSTYTDASSVSTYGKLEATRNTQLHNTSDANTQAQEFLAARAYPQYSPKTLTIDLNTPGISSTLAAALVGVTCGMPITANGLSDHFGNTFSGFIEGWTWTFSRGRAILTCTLSSEEENYPFTLWAQLNGTDTWKTYALSTTTWNDVI